ncbi:hypothetical protein [Microbacterium aureliae]
MWLSVTLVLFGVLALGSSSSGCTDFGGWTTTCENTGTQVDLSAGGTVPGTPTPGQDRHRNQAPPSAGTTPPAPGAGVSQPEDCGPLNRCGGYTVVMIPDVTVADLASFRPAAPTLDGEPAGFGVVGMPTNLIATASVQQMSGTLLDWDVVVRFEPAAYVFDHGDGTSARHTSGGATWQALGAGQFSPTETSHVYRARGAYTVGVTVQYSASVDFGDGRWRPVPGYVTATGGGYDVRVVEVRTALVDETCSEDPSGPGC